MKQATRITPPSPDIPKQTLELDVHQENPAFYSATVTIPAALVDRVYHQICLSQQNRIQALGFQDGHVPLSYIQENFRSNLNEHLKEFLFKYLVINFSYQQIHDRKLLVAGEPRLVSIQVEPGSNAQFVFEFSASPKLEINDWKYLPFKAPKRKNYKDLDRQVESFMKEEKEQQKEGKHNAIKVGDWVCFDVALINQESQQPLLDHKERFWLKIGDEEADTVLGKLFLDKKVGDSFLTDNQGLQEYFYNQMNSLYTFHVDIADTLCNCHFCIDCFKRHFRLKTNKEVFKKLIEVFSYRNDLSQRRSTVEESLKLLLSKHRFEVPNHLVLRQQQIVLDAIKSNSDYHVYRTQKDFKKQMQQLAEKQIKEYIFLDQLACHENIQATDQDIKSYLNLTNRPRTKEFIYFDPPVTKIQGQELPMPTELLRQYCLREKTLNHIIYHLTRK